MIKVLTGAAALAAGLAIAVPVAIADTGDPPGGPEPTTVATADAPEVVPTPPTVVIVLTTHRSRIEAKTKKHHRRHAV